MTILQSNFLVGGVPTISSTMTNTGTVILSEIVPNANAAELEGAASAREQAAIARTAANEARAYADAANDAKAVVAPLADASAKSAADASASAAAIAGAVDQATASASSADASARRAAAASATASGVEQNVVATVATIERDAAAAAQAAAAAAEHKAYAEQARADAIAQGDRAAARAHDADVSATGIEAAQAASEAAQRASETAQHASEAAQHASETARDASRDARDRASASATAAAGSAADALAARDAAAASAGAADGSKAAALVALHDAQAAQASAETARDAATAQVDAAKLLARTTIADNVSATQAARDVAIAQAGIATDKAAAAAASKTAAETAQVASETAKSGSEIARRDAEDARYRAATSASAAQDSAAAAQAARDAAALSATAGEGSRATIISYRDDARADAAGAAASAAAAGTSKADAQTARDVALAQADIATTKAASAAASATSAAASEAAALASRDKAKIQADAAAASAVDSDASATAASTARVGAEAARDTSIAKAGEAAASATAAATSKANTDSARDAAIAQAQAAAGSAATATDAATAAAASKVAAETARDTATTKAAAAVTSAGAADASRIAASDAAGTAADKAAAATASATAADSSKKAAATSAATATDAATASDGNRKAAEAARDVALAESARAATAATAADGSKTAAAGSATAAAGSATTASTNATAAAASAKAAADSATAAGGSVASVTASAQLATDAATAAGASATSARDYATTANNAAHNAEIARDAAAGSASAASTSASDAKAAADRAQANSSVSQPLTGRDASDGYAGLTGYALNLKNALGSVLSRLTNANTSPRVYTLPDRDMTFAGKDEIDALSATVGTKLDASVRDAVGGMAGVDTSFRLRMKNAAGSIVSYFTNTATATRTYSLPDKSGTVALTSDITGTNSGTNTGDETNATIKAKLGKATAAAQGYLDPADFTRFDAKQPALGYTPIDTAVIGSVNGVAPLGADGKVPAAYLPGTVNTGDGNAPVTDSQFDGRVLGTVVAGFSTATNAIANASDTVLTALGKLQAQVTGRAMKGANSDITSLSGLTTALSVEQGGTGGKNAADARTGLGLGNVENKSSASIRGELTAANVATALGSDALVRKHLAAYTYNGPMGLATIGNQSGVDQSAAWSAEHQFRISQAADTQKASIGASGAGASVDYVYIGINSTDSNAAAATNALRVYATGPQWGASKIWHAGNDGAGSGLDADLLSGYQLDAAATANTVAQRDASGALFADHVNLGHAQAARLTDTIFYSSTDGYMRKNTAAGFKSSLALDQVDNKSSATIRGELTQANVETALTFGPARRASFASGAVNSVAAITSLRTVADPSAGVGFAGGVRFRFGYLNDVSGSYADIIDLSTYVDTSGGGVNSLYFNKQAQTIQHKYAAAGATTWTAKTLAYTDSNITGSAANITGIASIYNGGTGAATAVDARTNLGLGNVENKSSATIRGELTAANVATAQGYTAVQQGSGVGQGPNAVKIGWSATLPQLLLTVDATNFGNSWPINAATATAVAWTGVGGKPTTIAGFGITDDLLSYKGAYAAANVDTITASGFYQQTDSGATSALVVHNTLGSVGPLQQRFTYGGNFEFRNKTDSTTWTAWKTVVTSANVSSYTAGAATKLATARTINGVPFDGSANITIADPTKAPLTGAAFTGTVQTTSTLLALSGTDNEVAIGPSTTYPSIEMGKTGRTTTATPFIDFHSSANSPDYDSRIIASGGDGTVGGGLLQIYAAGLQWNGAPLAKKSDLTDVGLSTVAAAPYIPNLDDVSVVAGMYYVDASTRGTHPATPQGAFVLHKVYGVAGFQLYQPFNVDELYYRRRINNWGSWKKLRHEDSVVLMAQGGTNNTVTPPAGSVAFGNGACINYTAVGVAGQFLKSNGAGTPLWATLGLADLPASLLTTSALASTTLTGLTSMQRISFNRQATTANGIQWFTPSYNAWATYMANAGNGGQGPNGALTAPSGTLVTTWALRNVIESVGGYGWTWETMAANGTSPAVVAEIHSDGSARFTGNVYALSFRGGAFSSGLCETNGNDGWWRSGGSCGWYSTSFGSGIYANKSGEVRTYNNSDFYSEGSITAKNSFYGNGAGLSGYAASLTAGNTNSITAALWEGHAWSGQQVFVQNVGANTYGKDVGYLTEFRTTDGACAGFTFHRAGYFATNMTLDPDGCIRIGGISAGTSSARFSFNATNGDFTAQSNVIAYSDGRLKTDWKDVPDDFIERWSTVQHGSYRRIDAGMDFDRRHVGLVAQDVLSILPDAVPMQADGYYGLNYGAAAAVASVQAAKRIVEMEARLNRQDAQLEEQGKLIEQLMQAIETLKCK